MAENTDRWLNANVFAQTDDNLFELEVSSFRAVSRVIFSLRMAFRGTKEGSNNKYDPVFVYFEYLYVEHNEYETAK